MMKQVIPCEWNHEAIPIARVKAPSEPVKGQGLYSTKWNGWRIIMIFNYKPYTWKVFVLFILKPYYEGKGP